MRCVSPHREFIHDVPLCANPVPSGHDVHHRYSLCHCHRQHNSLLHLHHARQFTTSYTSPSPLPNTTKTNHQPFQTLTGLLSSYIICIACVLTKRLRGEPFPPSRWSLGRAGTPINIISLAFLAVAWVFMFFPAAPNPNPAGFNWSIIIYGAVILFFIIFYMVKGRHQYSGPVVLVRKDV